MAADFTYGTHNVFVPGLPLPAVGVRVRLLHLDSDTEAQTYDMYGNPAVLRTNVLGLVLRFKGSIAQGRLVVDGTDLPPLDVQSIEAPSAAAEAAALAAADAASRAQAAEAAAQQAADMATAPTDEAVNAVLTDAATAAGETLRTVATSRATDAAETVAYDAAVSAVSDNPDVAQAAANLAQSEEGLLRGDATAEDPSNSDVHVALPFTQSLSEWLRNFLEVREDGSPTDWAAQLIAEALERIGWGGGGGSGGTLVTGGGGDLLEMWTPYPYPRAREALSEPVVRLEDAGVGESIGYPMLFFDRYGELWVAWSTDHAPTWDDSGTWVAKFYSGPLGGVDKSTIQRVYRSDNVAGAQHETPMMRWYEPEEQYQMLYSKGGGRGAQSTFLATAPEITGPWTDEGVVQQMESKLQPGNGHTGYLYPQRVNGQWQSTSRYGGTPLGRQGYWYGSDDWRTWVPDPRFQGDFVEVLEDFAWFDPEADGGGHRFVASFPLQYNGGYWTFAGVSGANFEDPDYGSTVARFAAPLADDLRRVKGRPIVLAPDELSPGTSFVVWGGKAYSVARLGGPRAPGETALWIREVY